MQSNPERVESNRPHRRARRVAHSISKVLVHGIYSTKNRQPFLQDPALRAELHKYIGGVLKRLDCQPIIVGGVADHLHFLSALARTCDQAELVKETKRASSLWVKNKGQKYAKFAWQSGYGIFSIGFSQIKTARAYIENQEEHHKKVSFQDEFRKFLQHYQIEFDERYLWD